MQKERHVQRSQEEKQTVWLQNSEQGRWYKCGRKGLVLTGNQGGIKEDSLFSGFNKGVDLLIWRKLQGKKGREMKSLFCSH